MKYLPETTSNQNRTKPMRNSCAHISSATKRSTYPASRLIHSAALPVLRPIIVINRKKAAPPNHRTLRVHTQTSRQRKRKQRASVLMRKVCAQAGNMFSEGSTRNRTPIGPIGLPAMLSARVQCDGKRGTQTAQPKYQNEKAANCCTRAWDKRLATAVGQWTGTVLLSKKGKLVSIVQIVPPSHPYGWIPYLIPSAAWGMK